MKSISFLSLFIIIFILFTKCSVNSEADGVAQKKWDSILLDCSGNTYLFYTDYNSVYNYHKIELIELKDYSITTIAHHISEADKLNGIEWNGKSSINAKASRRCIFINGKVSEKWSPWNNWNTSESFDLVKYNGEWQLGLLLKEQIIYRGDGRYRFRDCNEINKLVSMAK